MPIFKSNIDFLIPSLILIYNIYSKKISLKLIGKIMSKLKIFLASINANELIAELEKDPATLNINDEVLPNHLEEFTKNFKRR